MENTGTSPLEVANPSNKTSLETPDLSLEVLNKTQQLIDLGSPSKSPSPTESPKERPSLFRSPSERQSVKIKHSLARSLSLDNKKVTRSKVTDDFEHTELTFGKKPRVKKMVTIKLEEAFKLIPMCTGEDDIYPFINACDMAVNLVEEKCAPTLVKYITTRLSGRALEMIKYKNVTKWSYIKSYLMDAFEDTTTASSLQIQLNSIKMRHGEDVNAYCHRVEKLYYKLCTACTLNKEESEAKIIHKTLKEQTLNIFIKGLITPIRTILKARNPKTLEVAKQLAKVEEVEYNSERENNRYRNDFNKSNYNASRQNNNNFQRVNNTRNNNTNSRIRNFQPNNFSKPNYQGRTNNYTQQNSFNRPPIKCYNCNGNHYAAQCRNKPASNNNRPSNRNSFTQPPTNYNARASTCAYCKRSGHDISACYKKRNNESRNNNSGNANVSGEDRGTRSINQIIAEEMHNVTTSSLL
ncbi:hypothetical protein AGLY_016471 [Aphis glycines]|uniref:Retrotransposon gag domain-containing protein n=1 Tax=Aphis glycines TaxID=307491 RepID=A0A6G0SXK5_APHGL|nr:hypothetical protein AGLY_016471 [Aphis glycines]